MVTVLTETRGWLIAVKPAGVASEPEPTGDADMTALLREQTGAPVYPVHRLDKPTGGLLVYAKNAGVAAKLGEQITGGLFQKEYFAVIAGKPEKESDTLRDFLFFDRIKGKSFPADASKKGAKEAVLSYTWMETVETDAGALSLLRIRLETGRTHQIRAQFSARGLPLVGDGKYGSKIRAKTPALWAAALAFRDPGTGKEIRRELPPPAEYPWHIFSSIEKTGGEDHGKNQ
ncbi:MAG: RluA family pseudouridine synthase [Ruminococcus sp.]|nr:RluA family pseudouridine synthase [Candidatus Apopatosoma intestinale]